MLAGAACFASGAVCADAGDAEIAVKAVLTSKGPICLVRRLFVRLHLFAIWSSPLPSTMIDVRIYKYE
jgi:hypothetical protein